jgi:DNA-binding transcriptional LysR family regulator
MGCMNIDLPALRAFVCVAAELNFTRAAATLHISASSLTRVIQHLEQQVGVKLLTRSTHSVTLTPAGTVFLQSARRMVAEADWVGRRFTRHRAAGCATFTVGCVSGALYDALPERVRAARVSHPGMQFRLIEMNEAVLTHQVLDGTLDMGFLYFPTPDEDVVSRVVSRSAQLVAMERGHALAGGQTLAVEDLAGHRLILPDEAQSPRLHRWYRSFLDKHGSHTFQYVEANHISVALGLCAAGEGLCVCPETLRRARPDDLHFALLPQAPQTALYAVWRQDSPVRQVAQLLAQWGAPVEGLAQ